MTRKPLLSSDDLAHGQIVIITARWILVLAGLFLTLWNPGPMLVLRFQVAVILALAVANFYLGAQVIMRRPALTAVIYGASLADLVVITTIVALQGGFASNVFVFYYPALLTFSVVFPTAMLAVFAGGALTLYAFVGLFTLTSAGDFPTLIIRLLMLAAVAVVGHEYTRGERTRQRSLPMARPLPAAPLAQEIA